MREMQEWWSMRRVSVTELPSAAVAKSCQCSALIGTTRAPRREMLLDNFTRSVLLLAVADWSASQTSFEKQLHT